LEVKEVAMYRKYIRNEKGDLSYFSIFVILAVNMILAFVLLFASIKINCINIQNAAKMELNNVSARIYADTYHSQREANLSSYMSDLHISSAYQEALRSGFISNLQSRIETSNEDYRISNINLSFYQYGGKIEYVFSCDAQFYIRMCGTVFPPVNQHITLTGSHNTKY